MGTRHSECVLPTVQGQRDEQSNTHIMDPCKGRTPPCKGTTAEMAVYTLCTLWPHREEQDLPSAIPSLQVPLLFPNQPELCRLKCSTRRCHQVEAPSQAVPALPGLVLRAGQGGGCGTACPAPCWADGSVKVPGELQQVPWLVGSGTKPG